ncbi:MAG: aldehyde ferredoxin oxidoreductase [Deltaproteobacteria bacterium]|nr:aldehyde ferredoxin oxidoreductase [Deltaproteobacteria bacterium]MBW1925113.1 aldehyde ferredoxin oxidoreductase [Deltaproteobacteria bacterium]MBW1950399.1 aldehyde ferredoxin oxidoreductase [Deltaproteobacteria bacterium]MBW2009259.1 aldehyde ferredoxin oxidoreductase [Deltaproteobacteria bacterium]MBW2102350.1 aldehyde ferredoxin oxidoreductase [Deltaproteobacteria bacterium]
MKFLRVDMKTKTVKTEDVPPAYRGLGGRGLTSILVNDEVPPGCDPLGPENRMVFAPGLLTGTALVNTSRISIGAKSPLTGGIKESNVGGTVPAALGKLGITAVVVEGQAPEGELYVLRIDARGEAALEAANECKGMRTYALVEKLLGTYGEKNGVLCIGPAGEFLMSSASIQSSDADGRPCRAAGRGGLGAVMGSKGLKALVVDLTGKSPDALADPEAFKEQAKAFAEILRKNPFTGQMMPALGTAGLVSAVNSLGAFPSYNATQGTLEGWEKVSGEALAQMIQDRGGKTSHMGCTQCILHCSNDFVDEKGGFVTSSLEYETIWSMGGMTGIVDLDAIARLDRLADDIGLDTMNTGVALAVAMDAGYRPFGDAEAALEMMEEIGRGTDMGKILGNGPAAVGKHFNHHRVPVVKNQSIAAYDPRGMQGNGVTYATSPMGADHTAGNLVGQYLGRALDPLSPEGQVEASRNAQIAMAALDCTGICLLAGTVLGNPKVLDVFLKLIAAKTGEDIDAKGWGDMGIRVLKAERAFNRNAGFTSRDDRLPEFFREEPLPPHNKTFLVPDEELDSIFDF